MHEAQTRAMITFCTYTPEGNTPPSVQSGGARMLAVAKLIACWQPAWRTPLITNKTIRCKFIDLARHKTFRALREVLLIRPYETLQ